MENSKILDWVDATAVRIALDGISEFDPLISEVVEARKELVLTAMEVALFERYDQALKQVNISRETLGRMGVGNLTQEIVEMKQDQEEEVLVSKDEYDNLALLIRGSIHSFPERVWRALYRNRKDNNLFDDNKLSLQRLSGLLNDGAHLPGIGEAGLHFLKQIMNSKIRSEDS
jgi:hypothetical protein